MNNAMNTVGLVLTFKATGSAGTAARLHAAGCSVVAGAMKNPRNIVVNGKMTIIKGDDSVAAEVADLIDRKYKVAKCKCCPAE